MRNRILAAGFLCVAASLPALALHPEPNRFITVALDGQNEVDQNGNRGVGDPDGSASARLEEDHGSLIWSISYQNLSGQAISGFRIHGPSATLTNNRPVLLSFPLPAGGGELPDGTIGGVLTPQQVPGLQTMIAGILFNDDPSGFYLNLYTTGEGGFPDGAVRGQLPEPGAAAILAFAAMSMMRRPRRRSGRGHIRNPVEALLI